MIKLLSTKQLDEKDLAYARAMNFDVTCTQFIEIKPVDWDEKVLTEHDFQSVGFTSSSAVKYFLAKPATVEWMKDKVIIALSGKTTDELLKYGFEPVITAENSLQLTEKVANRKLTGSVLHVCGNITLGTLEKMVKDAGIHYRPLVVYNTELKKGIHLDKQFDAILFYSPSGVEGFLSANTIGEKTICCCIGNTTAARLRESVPNAKVVISPFPSPKSMLERVAIYFDKPLA